MPITSAFFYITLRVPSKGAPCPGSFHRAPIEKDAPFPELPYNCLSEFPVNGPPHDTQQDPCGERCLSPEPLQGPVDKPPTKFLSGTPTESDVHPLSPPPRILPDPRKGAPVTELPKREMLPFWSPPTIS